MIWSRRTGCVQRGHNQLGTWCLHGLELHPRRWLQWLGGEPEWGYMLVQHVQPGDPSQFCERLQQNQLVSMWTYHAARNLLPRRSIMCLLLCGCHHQHKWEWAGTQLEHHYHDYDEDQDDLPRNRRNRRNRREHRRNRRQNRRNRRQHARQYRYSWGGAGWKMWDARFF